MDKAHTLRYLVETGYGKGKMDFPRLRQEAVDESGSQDVVLGEKQPSHLLARSVIEDWGFSRTKYTAKHLFALNKCRRDTSTFVSYNPKEYKTQLVTYRGEYDLLDASEKELWELNARQHDEMQPSIKHQIVALV